MKWLDDFTNPMHESDYYQNRYKAYDAIRDMDNRPAMKALSSAAWLQAGRSQENTASGRTSSIAFDPAGPIYLGSISGGLWKSTDNGTNWVSLSETWKILTVGGVAVDPVHPNIIYCGTGAPLSYVGGGADVTGVGIYKSVDGGLNWNLLAGSPIGAISDMEVNRGNPELVYCCTTGGVRMSSDSGHSWKSVLNLSGETRIVFDPNNPGIIYAGGGGNVEKSTDSGKTWTLLSGYPSGYLMVLGMSNVSSDSIYLSTGYGGQNGGTSGSTISLSTDAGATWTTTSSNKNYLGSQAGYANALAVNPTNPAIVVVGGLDIYSSTRAGASLTKKTNWTSSGANPDYAHADVHGLKYNPYTNQLFAMTDGGIFHSETNGATWEQNMNANLPTLLFIGGDMGVDANGNPAFFAAGAQDNGTNKLTAGSSAFTVLFGGDGGSVYVSPADGQTIYGTYTNGTLFTCADGGVAWADQTSNLGFAGFQPDNILANTPAANTNLPFYIEYDVCDQDPNVVAVCGGSSVYTGGTTDLFLSNDGGQAGLSGGTDFASVTTGAGISGAIRAVHIAKNNSQYVFIGTASSKFYYSTDQGVTWTASKSTFGGNPISITSDPNDETHLFMAIAGANSKHFYVSTDTGRTWTAPATNLPNGVNYHRVACDGNGNIFIGHDFGVLRSHDGGVTWYPVADGFPFAMVTSLRVRSHYLVATTYGRGMFYVDINQLPSLSNSVAQTTSTNAGTPAIKDIYPSIVMSSAARMNVDYSLATDTHATLTVFDILGREERVLVNEFTSKGDHSMVADLSGISRGQHYLVLTADGFSTTKPLTIE